MSMFDCPHCGDTHHVNDFCATGPMSQQTTPSNANTSGLIEKLVQRARVSTDPLLAMYAVEASKVIVTAASAQARIAELEGELEEARTIDAGFWAWLGERDLQPDGLDVEWGDIVVALTEHVDNAYDIADKATARATAAEARADRLAKALEPFAAVLVDIGQTEDDADCFRNPSRDYAKSKGLCVGDLRCAAAALQQEG